MSDIHLVGGEMYCWPQTTSVRHQACKCGRVLREINCGDYETIRRTCVKCGTVCQLGSVRMVNRLSGLRLVKWNEVNANPTQ